MVRAAIAYEVLRTEKTYIALRTEKTYIALRTDMDCGDLRTDKEYIVLWTDKDYVLLWTNKGYIVLGYTKISATGSNRATIRQDLCSATNSKNCVDLRTEKEIVVPSTHECGSLSPRHGASSGCGWRNGLQYGG